MRTQLKMQHMNDETTVSSQTQNRHKQKQFVNIKHGMWQM